jgi:hypothetical protein
MAGGKILSEEDRRRRTGGLNAGNWGQEFQQIYQQAQQLKTQRGNADRQTTMNVAAKQGKDAITKQKTANAGQLATQMAQNTGALATTTASNQGQMERQQLVGEQNLNQGRETDRRKLITDAIAKGAPITPGMVGTFDSAGNFASGLERADINIPQKAPEDKYSIVNNPNAGINAGQQIINERTGEISNAPAPIDQKRMGDFYSRWMQMDNIGRAELMKQMTPEEQAEMQRRLSTNR